MDISRIPVDELPDSGLALTTVEPVKRFKGLNDLQGQGQWTFPDPLRLELRIDRIDEYIDLSGLLETAADTECSRCLAAFSLPFSIRFHFTYTKSPLLESEYEPGKELELSAEEMGLVPFDGKHIDLTEALQAEILMALPMQPLCDVDCKGLCPRCGANLNQGDCGCRHNVIHPGFEVLKGLKIDKND